MMLYCSTRLSTSRFFYSILSLALFCLMISSSFSSDFRSARTSSLGGAGHAAPTATDAVYMNPSYTAFIQKYAMTSSFAYVRGDERGRTFNLAIQDGQSELFQAGMGYMNRYDGTWVHGGAAKNFIQNYGFGMGVKNFFNGGSSRKSGYDMNLSLTGSLSDSLQFAIIGDNLLQTKAGKTWGLTREIILGTKFNLQNILVLYVDPHYYPSIETVSLRKGYEAGIELKLGQDFSVRGGKYYHSFIPQFSGLANGVGFGAGWIGPKISLDAAIEYTKEPVKSKQVEFTLSIFL